MNKYVTDTMAIIKALNGKKVINNTIHSIFEDADKGKNIILIPSIVITEICYLYEKGRIKISIENIEEIISDAFNFVEEPLTLDIIKSSFEITDIPELHDRLIAGTAKYLDVPLLTNDPVIIKSKFVKIIPGD